MAIDVVRPLRWEDDALVLLDQTRIAQICRLLRWDDGELVEEVDYERLDDSCCWTGF